MNYKEMLEEIEDWEKIKVLIKNEDVKKSIENHIEDIRLRIDEYAS